MVQNRMGHKPAERFERQGHNEGNYAGTVLGARGIRPACIPGVLIKMNRMQVRIEFSRSAAARDSRRESGLRFSASVPTPDRFPS